MVYLSIVKKIKDSTSPYSISLSPASSISTSGTFLISSSLSITTITTHLFLLYPEYIMGMIFHQPEWPPVVHIMSQGIVEFTEWSMMHILVLLQCWEMGWYMVPLSTKFVPLHLRPEWNWIWCTYFHIVSNCRTLIYIVPLRSTRCTPYMILYNFCIFHIR